MIDRATKLTFYKVIVMYVGNAEYSPPETYTHRPPVTNGRELNKVRKHAELTDIPVMCERVAAM